MSDQPSTASAKYNLTSLLGDLGSLPFILLAGLMANAHFNGPGLTVRSLLGLYAPYVFIAYSAVILSFLSGALWERERERERERRRLAEPNRLASVTILFSNFIALSAWACLLLIYVAPIMTSVCRLSADGGLFKLALGRAPDRSGGADWQQLLVDALTNHNFSSVVARAGRGTDARGVIK